jgi:hypothetical protein
MIGLRVPPEFRRAVEVWAKAQPDPPTLSEAIRRLVELGLSTSPLAKQRTQKSREKASEMAGQRIDELANPALPEEERRARKRRLIKGPSEFRDMRGEARRKR